MKIAAGKIEGFLGSPEPTVRAVLLFGPDSGLVRERAKRLAQSRVEQLDDPFRVADLDGAVLKADPARLSDEASAMAFGGGERVVRIRDVGDAHTPVFKDYFASCREGDALIVVEAGDLAARSSLRKLFEDQKSGAAIGCYADDGRSLGQVIRETLGAQGLRIDRDAEALLVELLGSDRQVSRGEVEKLALYMGPDGGEVTLQDIKACIGDSGALSMDNAILAAAGGDARTMEREVDRLFQEGNSPVAILRAAQRHFQRLHLAAGLMRSGLGEDQAMGKLRPPVFFRAAPAFKRQLRIWSGERLTSALDLLVEAEGDCKTTGLPAETICRRALLRLCQAAGRG